MKLKEVDTLCKPGFWKDVLKIWSDLNCNMSQNIQDIQAEIIWYNHQIKDKNHERIYIHRLWQNGINTVHHFINYDAQRYLTITEFQQKWNLYIDPITYHKIILAFPYLWKTLLEKHLDKPKTLHMWDFLQKNLSTTVSKLFYEKINTPKDHKFFTIDRIRWQSDLKVTWSEEEF